MECLSGNPTIIETLTPENLQFSISPQAFFQVNTEGAEKVRKAVTISLVGHNLSTLLDDLDY